MRKFCLSIIPFWLLIICFSQTVFATGLTVFSYRDEYNQLRVTDSIEKIPQKFRSSVEEHKIERIEKVEPIQKPVSPDPVSSATVSSATVSPPPATPDTRVTSVSLSQPVKEGPMLEVIQHASSEDPIEEPLDPDLASASEMLKLLNSLSENFEMIIHIAMRFERPTPQMAYFHTTNLQSFEKLLEFSGFSWKLHQEWSNYAQQLRNAFGAILFSITGWLNSGHTPQGYIQDLYRQFAATRNLLNQLSTDFQSFSKR